MKFKHKIIHKIRMKINNLGDYINNNHCSKYDKSIYCFYAHYFLNKLNIINKIFIIYGLY